MTLVHADLELRLVRDGDQPAPVPSHLVYREHDPWTVMVVFRTAEGAVTWFFGRELLAAGITAPAGQGDVRVWPARTADGDQLCLALSSPHGNALLEADLATVRDFLARTWEIVPAGTEIAHIDMDAELEDLLAAGA